MSILDEAKEHLATYGAAHIECCGTPLIRKLVAALEAAENREVIKGEVGREWPPHGEI